MGEVCIGEIEEDRLLLVEKEGWDGTTNRKEPGDREKRKTS